jgi:glycerol uptake facilitator-like aquaporin
VTSVQLLRRATAELVGTAFLLIAVVGSGIAAQRLSPGDRGLALLENAVATGAALMAIILAVGSVSGAHLNPLVTVVDAAFGGLRWQEVPVYIVAQVSGAIVGVIIANLMFSLEAITFSTRDRWSGGTGLGEIVATLGLLLVIFGISRRGTPAAVPFAVGAYITGAYFFTSSTSFANPAVTVGRMLSNTFAGISPASVAPFIAAQLAGGAVAWLLIRTLFADVRDHARGVVVPRPATSDDSR